MDVEQLIANKDGWFTPAQAATYYGRTRTLEEIVLHHWDTPANRPGFQSNLNYLSDPPGGVPTANCIIGYDEAAGHVRIIDSVTYPNVAFTSSGPNLASLKNARANYINCVSVGIEVDPLVETSGPHRADIINAVGYRVWRYRVEAGRNDIPLTRHSDYVYTECPGMMPIDEIEANAQEWAKGDDVLTDGDIANMYVAMVGRLPTPNDTAAWLAKPSLTLFNVLNSSQEHRDFFQSNDGDVVNICNALRIPKDPTLLGLTWKTLNYTILKKIPAGVVNHDSALAYVQANLK